MNFCLDDGTPLLAYDSTKYDAEAPTLVLDFKTQPLTAIPKVVKRQFHEENGIWTIKITYPQLEGLTSDYIQQRINVLLRKKFFRLTENTVENYDVTDRSHSELITGYKVTLISHDTLSVHLSDYSETEGTAHPNHYYEAFTFDLRSGYEFTYEDLFKPDSDYKNIIPALMTTFLEKQAARDKYEFHPFEKRESFNFYLTSKSLVIINVYNFHVAQHIEVPIKLSEIKKIIHPEGPLAFSLSSKTHS